MKPYFLPAFFLMHILNTHAQTCPQISVNSVNFTAEEGENTTFYARLSNTGNMRLAYNWAVSAGAIVSGQGSGKIEVATKGLANNFITATVEISGLPKDCMSTASTTIEILPGAEKVVAENYTTIAALTNTVQKFTDQIQLTNLDISQKAFIYLYPGVTTTAAQMKSITEALQKAFEEKNVFSFQYIVVEGKKKKVTSFEMYKVPTGAKDPKPSE